RQRQGPLIAGPPLEHLSSAQGGERHGMQVRRTDSRARVEQGAGLRADPLGGTVRRGGTQRPQRPAPGILYFRRAAPATVVAEAVTELPVRCLSPREKVEVAAAQGDEV